MGGRTPSFSKKTLSEGTDSSKRVFNPIPLLRSIILEGQQSGELGTAFSVNEMVKTYALCERAFLYDWCLVGGEYPLAEYSRRTLPLFLKGYLAPKES